MNNLRIMAIVHGKSEYQLCRFIKQQLRMPMEIIADKKGEKSIQINSLIYFLEHHAALKSEKCFKKVYKNYLLYDKKCRPVISDDLKIFTIMDTDDCNTVQKQNYINRTMFNGLWLSKHIVPIYNTQNLEEVLKKSGIEYRKKHIREQKREYIEIFPTEAKYRQNCGILDLEYFMKNLEHIKCSNMAYFIQCCLNASKNNCEL